MYPVGPTRWSSEPELPTRAFVQRLHRDGLSLMLGVTDRMPSGYWSIWRSHRHSDGATSRVLLKCHESAEKCDTHIRAFIDRRLWEVEHPSVEVLVVKRHPDWAEMALDSAARLMPPLYDWESVRSDELTSDLIGTDGLLEWTIGPGDLL